MKEFVITNDFHIKVSLSLKLLVSILLQNDLLLTTWNTYRVSFWPGGINYQLRKKTDTTETLVTFLPLNFARKRYWTNYSFDGLNRPFVEFIVISLLWSFNLVLSFATLLLILGSIFFFFFFQYMHQVNLSKHFCFYPWISKSLYYLQNWENWKPTLLPTLAKTSTNILAAFFRCVRISQGLKHGKNISRG